MSDPQRYSLSEPDISYGMDEDSKGEYVLWKDYARLKAEVERLRKFNDEALAHIAKEERKSRECLDMAQADVERLIKAGDKLVEAIQEMDVIIDMDSEHPEVNAWNAAKEASQA